MKKTILPLFLASALLTGCGTTGGSQAAGDIISAVAQQVLGGTTTDATTSTSPTTTATSAIGALTGVLSDLLGGSSLTEKDLVGTWRYQSSDCVFETENLLMKAGGAVAATQLESKVNTYISKAGISSSNTQFTFNSDKTFTARLAGRTISGTYVFNQKKKTVQLQALGGLFTMSPYVVRSGSNISLLFESDKLLNLASTVGSLSGNSTLKTLSSLLSQYDGLQVGLQMSK